MIQIKDFPKKLEDAIYKETGLTGDMYLYDLECFVENMKTTCEKDVKIEKALRKLIKFEKEREVNMLKLSRELRLKKDKEINDWCTEQKELIEDPTKMLKHLQKGVLGEHVKKCMEIINREMKNSLDGKVTEVTMKELILLGKTLETINNRINFENGSFH